MRLPRSGRNRSCPDRFQRCFTCGVTTNEYLWAIYLNKVWGCVILREIDFLLKICWSIPCFHPSWKVHTCIPKNRLTLLKNADGSEIFLYWKREIRLKGKLNRTKNSREHAHLVSGQLTKRNGRDVRLPLPLSFTATLLGLEANSFALEGSVASSVATESSKQNDSAFQQWRSQPKTFEGAKKSGEPKCLILGDQQDFVWDTALCFPTGNYSSISSDRRV